MKITANVQQSLDNAIHHVSTGAAIAQRDQLLDALNAARRHASASLLLPLQRSDGLHGPDEMYLSLAAAAMEDFKRQQGYEGLIGPEQFEPTDPRWISCLLARLTSVRQPLPSGTPQPIPIGDNVCLALAGDWGTGNGAAATIGHLMSARSPDFTIHLGDVYYCGTEAEEKRRFVDVWPSGTRGSFALNSNHEMYSGGEGYFKVTLPNVKFSRQGGFNYFALYNKNWLILGFDSAYTSRDFLYQSGDLSQPQIDFAAVMVHAPGVGLRPDSTPKRLLVMTHHNAIEGNGSVHDGFVGQMTTALGRLPDAWYWGHDHVPAVFPPRASGNAVMYTRCVGHGAVPYAPTGNQARVWTESSLAHDMDEAQRALNGFVTVELRAEKLTETFIGEDGSVRFASAF